MDARVQLSGPFYYVVQDTLRVLFVDDDPILREFASVHLATDSVAVETAADGHEALERVQNAQPDLMLLDLEMPNLDGFDVLRRLRADPATARLPVVVVTGREDVGAIDRAFEAGATSFVIKPINWRLLNYQVRYVHRTYRNEMALLEERAQARADERRATAAMTRVASETSRFLSTALKAEPRLRPQAAELASALQKAVAGEGD